MEFMPDLDAGLTATQAARAVGVSAAVVCLWHTRGWITGDGHRRHLAVVGHGARGQRLYRYGDVVDAERDTRLSPYNPGRLAAA